MGYIGLVFCLFTFNNSCIKEATHRKVYVSTSMGKDTNNGLSQQYPLKTIKKAIKLGDTVLLKAGDFFYESDLTLSKVFLSRYGEGGNPTICGYKRIVKPKWVEVEKNIWRLNLVEDNFTGIIVKGPSLSNNICALHDYKNDLIHGRKVWHKNEMNRDWDFWQTETLSGAKPEEYNEIFLYLTSNPNQLGLEMSIYDCAFILFNSTLDGVNIEGFGFGISAYSHTEIRNCKIDAIGGRIIPEKPSYICYGNGIEFYVDQLNIENCIVEDCYISRCYDCGVTIQGKSGTKLTPHNIKIRNNLITNCCQGWEDFLCNNRMYDNCSFSNNIVIHSGNTTGFGYQDSRFKFCHVLGNNIAGNKGMRIENNIFADGNFYCSGTYKNAYKSNLWEGNKCYIKNGDFILGEYFGRRDVLRIGKCRKSSSDVIERYRELTGDHTTTFYIWSEKRVMHKADSLKMLFLKTHSY